MSGKNRISTDLGISPGVFLLGSQNPDQVRRTLGEPLRPERIDELGLEGDVDLGGGNLDALRQY